MVSITHALARIKDDLADVLSGEFIQRVCREHGHNWRNRLLDPVTLVHLFIQQILHGNAACPALPRIAGRTFTASAYCQARTRLPLKVIAALAAKVGEHLRRTCGDAGSWKGHRTVLVDGSSFSMPDTPALQKQFGQPGGQRPGCGFPVAHLLVAFDADTGFLLDAVTAPMRTHDMAQIKHLHAWLRPGDVLVADRGLCSFAHLALILQGGWDACLRVHQRQIVHFQRRRSKKRNPRSRIGSPSSRWIKSLGHNDQLVEWVKSANKPTHMDQAEFDQLPESIRVRELRFRVRVPGSRTHEVTLVTTLLDPKRYPAKGLARLYRARWQVELNLRHLKTTMKMDVLRCKSVDGVLKEMWMFVLVYNLVRMVILEAARRQNVAPERVSFTDALRWLAYSVPDLNAKGLPELIVNPHRPNRIEPRAVKRRPKEFDRLTKPRAEMRKDLLNKRHAA